MSMNRPPPFALPAPQAGFTLLEVLVAVLVLSFGMLGVVGLQVAAMQANKEARYQSSGVRYARELAEAMRANKTALSNTTGPYLSMNYNAVNALPSSYGGTCLVSCAMPVLTTPTTHVDHTDLANFDVTDWFARASNELPGLRVVVCQDATPYNGVSAQWACTAPASNSAGENIYIKMGWTQQTTNRAATGQSGSAIVVRATDANGGIPLIVIPLMN